VKRAGDPQRVCSQAFFWVKLLAAMPRFALRAATAEMLKLDRERTLH
jgi:hypothetical protein